MISVGFVFNFCMVQRIEKRVFRNMETMLRGEDVELYTQYEFIRNGVNFN